MVLELGLAEGREFESHLCNLHVCFPFGIYWMLNVSPHLGVGLHVRESVKKYDMHIESKSAF